MEVGHTFSVIDEDTGRRRQAFADELTQPQQLFLFYAKEQRKKMRKESADKGNSEHSTTHHIT